MILDTPKTQCYDFCMSLEQLEKLEELIASYVSETHKLQAGNHHLEREVERLKSEIRASASKHEAVEAKLQKLALLENEKHKVESDKNLIRTKVKGMLEDLEKIESI